MSSIEAVREFFDANPCNFKRSKSEPGSKKFFDDIEKNKYLVEPHIPPFADYPRWQGRKVLDLGCGLGTETVNFARCGAHVTAVDLSPVSVGLLRQRCQHEKFNDNDVFLLCGNCEHLDSILPPGVMGSFDLVWAFGSLHHTQNPAAAVHQAFQALKSGGVIKAMVYSRVSWKRFNLLHEYGPWTPGRDGDATITWHSEASYGSPTTHCYSLNEARKLLEDAGFVHVSVQKTHIFRYDIEAYAEGRYKLQKCWESMAAEDVRDLEEELGWHTLIEGTKP